ncbi:CCA tRNA nucleotidyltransferase [Paenibacillus glycanilyticus]|uniref:CCA-adding enzyme n=1 Tax=Paenibacillus glycanilyticus TaxID=126569 RepID=A0ABQ6GFD2_9BACL|nr:CCA tRNA nucleotidyltransferase [Paenibacillus glycanilyticus]GLX68945.1 CCA-adding enzyme [Paenibacillus glycanilyticus]
MGIGHNLPAMMQQALPVLDKLTEQGFQAFFVGGCVRDTAMGIPIKDVDIASSAKPEQVMAIFPRCIPTGLQHGTVTVVHDGVPYEVTTFRTESEYEKHRRPLQVEFIDRLDGDLQRRDLTINAMAMNASGELYDPFGGLDDIHHKTVRSVGDADARFQEDALRMLRAIRFASQFEFTISDSTWNALLHHRELLRFIAMERVQAELDRMVSGTSPDAALRLLSESELLRYCGTSLPDVNKWTEPVTTGMLSGIAEPDTRYAALMITKDISAADAEETFKALRFPMIRTNAIMSILLLQINMRQQAGELRLAWTEAVIQYGEEAARRWLVVVDWDKQHKQHAHHQCLLDWLNGMSAITLKQLNLNGRQLAEGLQREPGLWTGQLLKRLLLDVALGKLPNTQPELLKQAQIWIIEEQ